MKIKSLIAATAIAVSSFGAMAGSATFAGGIATFSNDPFTGDVSNFTQTISFTGLAAGTYDIVGDISGSFLSFLSIDLDGNSWSLFPNSKGVVKFGEVVYTGSKPLTLTIQGKNLAGPTSFSGSVSAVPEPETFALLLAGLGMMGSIAMRRNKKKNS